MTVYTVDLGDFEYFSDGNMSYDTVSTGALDDSLSGEISYTDAGVKSLNLVATTAGAAAGSLGQLRGQMTMHVKPTTLPSNDANKNVGFASMQSARDITGNNGTAYCAFARANSGDNVVGFSKLTAGLNTVASGELDTTPYTQVQGTDFYFRFIWLYDSDLGAVDLQIWVGESLATLTKTLEYIDNDTPYTASVAESLISVCGSTSGSGAWLVDNWDLAPA